MFETLKARTRAVAAKRRNAGAAGKTARGKAAVTFAARLTFDTMPRTSRAASARGSRSIM